MPGQTSLQNFLTDLTAGYTLFVSAQCVQMHYHRCFSVSELTLTSNVESDISQDFSARAGPLKPL